MNKTNAAQGLNQDQIGELLKIVERSSQTKNGPHDHAEFHRLITLAFGKNLPLVPINEFFQSDLANQDAQILWQYFVNNLPQDRYEVTQNTNQSNCDPYYVAKIMENGDIQNADKNLQFIIPINSEVRFQLDYGMKISNKARLIVNKPKHNQKTGEIQYTITQPLENEENQIDLFSESKLDSEYLEIVEPYMGEQNQFFIEFRVQFEESGSFFIQISYQDQIDEQQTLFSKAQYINVEPILNCKDKPMQIKEISLITVMSRCLGKINKWPEVLNNLQEQNYNAIHFTPFQQYGESFSHYSIADQNQIDDYFFDHPQELSAQQRLNQLKVTFDTIRKNGLLSIVDIVLNHTANNTQWVLDHPEATYNTDDCPHLWSAWILDKALQDFSLDYSNKKIPECPSAPYISNAQDLAAVMKAIQNRILNGLQIHDYFQCDVRNVMKTQFDPEIAEISSSNYEKFKIIFEKKGWFLKTNFDLIRDELTVGHGSGPNKFNVKLRMPEAAIFFMLKYDRNKTNARIEVEKQLNALNADWVKRAASYMGEAYQALEGNIRYFKIDQRKSLITPTNRIVEPYFSVLNNKQKTKVAHNGWVGGHNCMEDFGYVGWYYLKRHINIWADNIKLRYGQCPNDSPYLWEHMTNYVQSMASIADGFRLDNTHSTPIHVCQYLLQAARSKNKNLYVMAELFTSSPEQDAIFCRKLNLNGLVRELQNRGDAESLGTYFHQLCCQEAVLGMIDCDYKDLDGTSYKFLNSKKPVDMIYDCTHDNPSVVTKFNTGLIALPHLGLNALADCSIASTWGFDLLVKDQICCVSEKRTYPIFDQKHFLINNQIDVQLSKIQQQKQEEKIIKPTQFDYKFQIDYADAQSITVAGEFNGWQETIFLEKISNNTWKCKYTLPIDEQKSEYQFKFVINDKDWVINKNLPITNDGQGNINNKLVIPKGSQQLNTQPQIQESKNNIEKTYEDIRYARMLLNKVHLQCNMLNADIFMHQQANDVIVVTRQFQLDQFNDFDSYVSITRYCFYNKNVDYKYVQSIELPGFMSEVVFAGYLEIPDSVYSDPRLKDKNHIYGPGGCKLHSFNYLEGKFCHREKISELGEKLNFFFMPPSFTCVIKVKSRSYVKEAVAKLNGIRNDSSLKKCLVNVPASAINHIFFRCQNEEMDISQGKRGTYGLKNYGQFPYSGISSYIHILFKLKQTRNMGHELFDNIRQGDWLIEYTLNRIQEYQIQEPSIGLQKLSELFKDYLLAVKKLPNHLKPKYFSRVMESVYQCVVKEVMNNRMLDDFISDSNDLYVQKLSLAIYQMYGRVPSTYFKNHKDSLCAGLPHFSTGYMRCWGRDTFIALRGLFIITGLEDLARETILFFAKVYRHGLLPNLHDGGGNTRFNSRDAPWFFLQAIKDYISISEEGIKFMQEKFELHFKDDDQLKHQQKAQGRTLTILQLILEIVQRHCQGIEFREWNAGEKIDAHMKDQGFNVKIHCDLEKTGFCFGGNKDNCGTWMDKMGSAFGKNKGIPATPRDGAPIELVAMQYSILTWLEELSNSGVISENSVKINRNGKDIDVKFSDWSKKMHDNFERCFWVPQDKNEDNKYDIISNKVNRRGIYKDVYGSTDVYTDYQLRPNICIAMSYAPELFDKNHAKICLYNIQNILMEKGCMGIKTLDPKDRQYNGDYVNSDDSHGFNYHQGPEWVWPVGFFLKSLILFMNYKDQDEANQEIMKWLLPHKHHILTDKWQGLPELTNSHGKTCNDSCETQAWSISTILDALRDLHYYFLTIK